MQILSKPDFRVETVTVSVRVNIFKYIVLTPAKYKVS